MACEYCKSKGKMLIDEKGKFEGVEARILRGIGMLVIEGFYDGFESASGRSYCTIGEFETEINYCPMCGGKLREVDADGR